MSEFRANVTKVAFILGPSAVASGKPGILGDEPGVEAGAATVPEFPALSGTPVLPPSMLLVDGNRCVEEEEMKYRTASP